jgi:hypothetical protein
LSFGTKGWRSVVLLTAGCTGSPAPSASGHYGSPTGGTDALCGTREVTAGTDVRLDFTQLTTDPDGDVLDPSWYPVDTQVVVTHLQSADAVLACNGDGLHIDQADVAVITVTRDDVLQADWLPDDGATVISMYSRSWPTDWYLGVVLLPSGASVEESVIVTADLWGGP